MPCNFSPVQWFCMLLLLFQSSLANGQSLFERIFGEHERFSTRKGNGQLLHIACINPDGCKSPDCCSRTGDTVRVYGKMDKVDIKCSVNYHYSFYEYRRKRKNEKGKTYCIAGNENEFDDMPYAFQPAVSVNIKGQYFVQQESDLYNSVALFPAVDFAVYKRFKGPPGEKYAKLMSLDVEMAFQQNFKPVYDLSFNANAIHLRSGIGIYAGIGAGMSRWQGQYTTFFFLQSGFKFCIN